VQIISENVCARNPKEKIETINYISKLLVQKHSNNRISIVYPILMELVYNITALHVTKENKYIYYTCFCFYSPETQSMENISNSCSP